MLNYMLNSTDQRLVFLKKLYTLYEQTLSSMSFACKHHCAQCCTNNVTLTTLEGLQLAEALGVADDSSWSARLAAARKQPRFQPRLTINAIADHCLKGLPIPEETNDPQWGSCLLLDKDECPQYLQRPFGCRCMLSRSACQQTGYAQLPPFVITLNNVFLQYIEHLDQNGCSGNLLDILVLFQKDKYRQSYRQGRLGCGQAGLIPNRPIPSLMIPPEHRQRMRPVIAAVRQLSRDLA
jgi:Fe-S-cluster containining protein